MAATDQQSARVLADRIRSRKWTTPKYPGDATRIVMLLRANEIGDIRIQGYKKGSYRVGTFLPGNDICLPGDTPKTEPENSEWFDTTDAADECFETYLVAAIADGWTHYDRNKS